ncbi:Acetyl esterase/lipase [Anaerocolumna jejuensis DSM 15929]|uniref:Acetyl esterase/lipase n=1 Tax=Anaerocolumna jejuensis DSM 15929 TaxID=1121322 RepID=A0A1M7BTY2_9FIRM|nr:Acetyl esterase/lipase [Anaerocolumna jejuensis DSM 15929]
MSITSVIIRKQLTKYKYVMANRSLESCRSKQDLLGRLLKIPRRNKVTICYRSFSLFKGAMVIPKNEAKKGVLLYLHGGGYICGGMDYATSVGTILSVKCSIRVFCAAYRLAPEHKFPAALEDGLTAYQYLISSGYKPEQIILCGESTGGGLVYSLGLRIKKEKLPLPGGIISISPWSDLTLSGASYKFNKDAYPIMTKEQLEFYADCYAIDRDNPYVSPLFGEFQNFPPSLIFVGENEIMLDDANRLHEKLLSDKCESRLIVAQGMWHGYILYCLKENRCDFKEINSFLTDRLPGERSLLWMRLDNAAKIFPATYRRNNNHVFRLSATLTEEVDNTFLQSALDATVKRFPTIAVRLRRGLFWYYLEEIVMAPEIQEERAYPLAKMPFENIRKCAFRVLVYQNRIAVEFFHALTDGNGGLIFLKTLVAEYLKQRYTIEIPAVNGVLNCSEAATEQEKQDSFQKYAGTVTKSRAADNSYRLSGTNENEGYLNATTFLLDTKELLNAAKRQGVTLTVFVAAVLIKACYEIQNETVPLKKQKPLKLLIPVNLRKLFYSKSLRNFVLYVTPGINPQMGKWSLEEICKSIHHQMGLLVNKKEMAAMITANVRVEQLIVLRIIPLFLKNLVMKIAYNLVNEGKNCLALSNLGVVCLPDEMQNYIERFDFMLGASPQDVYNCGVISLGNLLCLNFVRSIKEPILEQKVYSILKMQGVNVKAEGNRR